MRKHIPNLITCLNATCGMTAILLLKYDRLLLAGAFILLAMVFDFLDGLLARLLRAPSALGKELDSLADLVSFGVAPALLAHVLIDEALGIGTGAWWEPLLLYSPVVIPAFSAWRLATFNLDTRQGHSFIGLPTPAHALFWVALLFTSRQASWLYDASWGNPWLLTACLLFLSVLMVSGLPMFSLKIASFAWGANRWRYAYLVAALLLFPFFHFAAFSLLVPLYVLFAVLEALTRRGCNR